MSVVRRLPVRLSRSAAVAALAAWLVVVAGCGPSIPSLQPEVNVPVFGSAAEPPFRLTLTAERGQYEAGQAIQVLARLDYEGLEPSVAMWGSGSGPVGFSIEQLDGPFDLGGAWTADCVKSSIDAAGQLIPFEKAGGWSSDDPMAAQFQQFMADPFFRLPPGTYRITALADFYLAECAQDAPHVDLSTSIDLVVTPAG